MGFDDDIFWQLAAAQDAVIANEESRQQPIPVTFISIPIDPSRPNRIPFNELVQAAFEKGAKYLVRINDDTWFDTSGWITLAIQTLQSFSPPDVGVVGPSCKGDSSAVRSIMTHDMTYLPHHLAIFGTYYPPVFDNWYIRRLDFFCLWTKSNQKDKRMGGSTRTISIWYTLQAVKRATSLFA